MAYTALTFVGGEVLTATKMNLLGANDAGFNDGTALADSIILPRHISTGAVTASKVDFATFGSTYNSSNTIISVSNSATILNTVTNPTSGVYFVIGQYQVSGGGVATINPQATISVTGSITLNTVVSSNINWAFGTNTWGTNISTTGVVTVTGAGTVRLQAQCTPTRSTENVHAIYMIRIG